MKPETVYNAEQPNASFLNWLMTQQLLFEMGIEGTDESLFAHNTLEHGLTRGVIGETHEALEDIALLKETEVFTPDQTELLKDIEKHLKTELVDILIFLGSVFIHAGMSPQEVMEIAMEKMEANHVKYARENFTGRTIAEGMQYSRDKHNGVLDDPVGSSGDAVGEVGEEPYYYPWYGQLG